MAERVNSADLWFEKEIFKAADKLRGNVDAAEYKNIVLGLIFLWNNFLEKDIILNFNLSYQISQCT